MILWLALPLIWLPYQSVNSSAHSTYRRKIAWYSRCEANAAGILFKLRVIETLLQGQGSRPRSVIRRVLILEHRDRAIFSHLLMANFVLVDTRKSHPFSGVVGGEGDCSISLSHARTHALTRSLTPTPTPTPSANPAIEGRSAKDSEKAPTACHSQTYRLCVASLIWSA